MSHQISDALRQIIDRRLTLRDSRVAAASFTNSRGRRDTAEDDSSASIVGSMTSVDASSCLESTEVTYVPPVTPSA